MKKATIFYIASEKFEPGFILSTTRDYYKVISYFNLSKGENIKPSYLSQLCEDLGEDPELYFNKAETIEYSDRRELNEKKREIGLRYNCCNAIDRRKSIYSVKYEPVKMFARALLYYNKNKSEIDENIKKRNIDLSKLSIHEFTNEVNRARCRIYYKKIF